MLGEFYVKTLVGLFAIYVPSANAPKSYRSRRHATLPALAQSTPVLSPGQSLALYTSLSNDTSLAVIDTRLFSIVPRVRVTRDWTFVDTFPTQRAVSCK